MTQNLAVSFHRVVKHDLTLSDGLFLPKGTHICMAAGPIYDFRFGPDQKDRPKNMMIGDKIVPNVSTPIFIRKRTTSKPL